MMESDKNLEFPNEVVDFLGKRIPKEMIDVFTVIWNYRKDGINWTELTKTVGDRYKVEKALLVLETIGFVSVESTINKREKKYIPDETRGLQLAKFIRSQKEQPASEEPGYQE
ncbi:hypothetical protein [Paenibacillus abyssi]|uniref:Uncharacterized protein n=1 Tax=Paenibacillus abyssi TaxID=1340531 RepID=A0A917G2C3_9BACL|nr:hypothetical protein [Paenibacillus abyssi]GGG18695.1 hypothetical protein GCM10010916_39360 [Paenibacillus abyssi]